jgi:hypothetical protein
MIEDTAKVSVGVCLEALAHVERRRLLFALLEAGGENRTVDLAQIQSSGSEVPNTSFHHVHLPKLEEAEFVQVESDRRTVRAGPRFDDIEPLLTAFDANRNRFAADLV